MQTQRFVQQVLGAQLVVIENGQIRTVDLSGRTQWLIGRQSAGANPDIPLTSRISSREHGRLMYAGDAWHYVDSPTNMNGTFHNGVKMPRIPGQSKSVRLSHGDVLRIDNADLNHVSAEGVMMMFSTVPIRGHWTTLSLAGRSSVLFGRDPSCDIVEPLPYLSAKHAKITCQNGRYYLSDCGSRAGTYLNGKQVKNNVPLREKDCIALCDRTYIFLGDKLLYVQLDRQQQRQQLQMTAPQSRPVVLRANIARKMVKNNSGSGMKELIRDIKIEIKEGTLVALLGTAGAGKSTVMNCLNGMDLDGVQGSVMYRNVDLMHSFDQMKHMIGSVPQQKTFHRFFTPEREFTYAAIKRLPADTTPNEIRSRVDQTLSMLSMNGVRNTRNGKLSGGEQTRVNVGIELVADRDLLCLDEPDQGLSPNYKHELFQIMRDLAHKNGKSVLTIIHDVSEIDMFDQVIMLAKVDGVGRLAFSGTPQEAKRFFGVDIRDAYALLERNPKQFVR